MSNKIKLLGRDGGEKTVSGKEYVNIARSSKSSFNYFGDNLPHSADWFIQRAAIKIRIQNLERQLKNARLAATLLRDLVIAEELADENTYPKELVMNDSEQIDIIQEMAEVAAEADLQNDSSTDLQGYELKL